MNAPGSLPLWQFDACALGEAYRAGTFTPLQVLNAHLERLETVQPVVNAMAWVDADGARQAAAASTARWFDGQPLSLFDGVPVTVKDNIPLAGLPCRWGSRLYEDHVPAQDESPVARLRAAGAVFLGKTTVPEFTLQGYTDSPVTGLTRNPWDPTLTPGGSSGGAVAAMAAGVGVLALATDGGGSIRRPAGHTGLYGFKPGWNVVPRDHGLPEMLPGMEVIGPLSRTARDLPLAMAVLTGDLAGTWPTAETPSPSQRIAYWRHIAGAPVDAEVLALSDHAAMRLRKLGHVVNEMEAPPDIQAFNQQGWPILSTTGLAHVLRKYPDAALDLSPALARLLDRGQAWSATDLFEAQALVRRLVRTLATGVFHTHDLVLTPCSAALPWPAADSHPTTIAGEPVDARGHAVFTAFVNATGMPALALPAGFARHLPVGVQLVGPSGSDQRLLALGLQWEREAGGSTTGWPLWP